MQASLSDEGCSLVQNVYHEYIYSYLDHICFYIKLFWFFLDEHTNFVQEGTSNGKKNCASCVTLMHNLDSFTEIPTFN